MPVRPPQSAICSLATSTQCLLPLRNTRPNCSPSHLSPSTRSTRAFHSSRSYHANPAKSHYETLGLPPTATKADLKKRFYTLSKETHPDINRSDPNASQRFSEVSEAYATLINEEKRKIYDRDVMPTFSPSSSSSFSSASRNRGGTYAGSRPATGLSKRRGTFRGPPPSFYSQGGQSANPDTAERVRREQESYDRAYNSPGGFDPSAYSSPGQWDPTFNPDPVMRTQTVEDQRRNQRRAADEALARAIMEEQGDFWGRFIIVSGVVAFGVGVGTMVNRMSDGPKGGLVKADGSRRSEWATNR